MWSSAISYLKLLPNYLTILRIWLLRSEFPEAQSYMDYLNIVSSDIITTAVEAVRVNFFSSTEQIALTLEEIVAE